MRKDIEIPVAENVYMAVIKEWNEDFQEDCWYAYLINDTNEVLEMPIVVSRAYGIINGEQRKTGTFRHSFKETEAKSFLKVELLENNVLALNNEFAVTYFIGNKLYDKTFVFKAKSINDLATRDIPVLQQRGILIK